MKHRIKYLAVILILFVPVVAGIFPKHVGAASNYQYTSDTYTAIQGPSPDGQNVTFRKVNDSSKWYGFGNGVYLDLGTPTSDNGSGTCYAAIQTANKKYDGDKNGKVYMECGSRGHSDSRSPKPITIDHAGAVGSVNTDQRQVFDYELCPTLKGIDQTLWNQTCNVDYASQSDQDNAVNKICNKYPGQLQKQCADYQNKTYNPDNAPGATPAAASSSLNCSLGITGINISSIFNALNPLNWLMCGLIQGMSLLVEGLDQGINNYLAVGTDSTGSDNPNQIFADSNGCSSQVKAGTCKDYHTAWSSFRDIALGLLAIVGLIIVISQALGMEILDAYTIRKMLPRVLIATIAIVLSWPLMRFAIVLSNDLGYGVGHLISAPFGGLGQSIGTGGVNNLLGTLAAALGGLLLDTFGLLSFVGTAAIAVIITFLVLTLRQIVIILLVIMSPLAIIAYVLPNTQRIYKFWWESFSKVLLMFPLIVAFITIGHVFSAIAASQSGDGIQGFINQTVAFIAYFGPYFAIPLTFRFAGAMMGGIGNAVNSRGEGARNLLRGYRSGRVKQHAAELKAGTRFESRIPGTRGIQDRLNEFTKGAGTGVKGRFGLGAVGRGARARVTQGAGMELLNSPEMKAIRGRNDFNRVLAEGMGDANLGRQALIDHLTSGGDDGKTFLSDGAAAVRADAAVNSAKAAGAFTRAHGVAAFYNMARDGTAIRDADDLGRLAARVGEGDATNTFTYAAEGASLSKQAGRPGLAASSESIGDLSFQHADEMYNNGRPNLYNPEAAGHKRLTPEQLADEAKMSAFGNTQMYEWYTQAKGRDLRTGHRFLAKVMSDKTERYSPEIKQKAAEHITSSLGAIKSGMGADNKRLEAYKALQPALDDYQTYMKQPTGETLVEQTPVRQYVEESPGVHTERVVPGTKERLKTNADVAAETGHVERQRGVGIEEIEGAGGRPPEEGEE